MRHILDRWHISMRSQHIENPAKGLLQTQNFPSIPVLFTKPAETLRWCLWNGKVMEVGTRLKVLLIDAARLVQKDAEVRVAASRVKARCKELYTYIDNNFDALTDYGWRYRHGFPISSCRAEGCVDDIGNTRMGKRRRMGWSPKGGLPCCRCPGRCPRRQVDHHNGGHLTTTICPLPVRCPPGRRQIELA